MTTVASDVTRLLIDADDIIIDDVNATCYQGRDVTHDVTVAAEDVGQCDANTYARASLYKRHRLICKDFLYAEQIAHLPNTLSVIREPYVVVNLLNYQTCLIHYVRLWEQLITEFPPTRTSTWI